MKKPLEFLFAAIQGLATLFLAAYFFSYAVNPETGFVLDAANLMFHEAGHSIFFIFGDFMSVLGGTIFQIGIPVFVALYFIARGDYYSGSIISLWTGQSIVNASLYIRDAAAKELPLLGGDAAIHDWNYILTRLDLLQYTPHIAGIAFWTGAVIIALSSVAAMYFVFFNPSKQEVFKD